ncbi:MAG: glycosyltransferase, partial [Candidatus Thermoplasmatota archaeon]|nr:glycosyltransferase [Candidatus Thermoplasmatota archaeon]
MFGFNLDIPLDTKIPRIDGWGNDYSFIKNQVGKVEPQIPITVVLPVYNRIDMLRRTIAMLTHQTYPLELIEVIIADDGSSDNPEQLIDEFNDYFEINYVRQRDEGYRLSHIRNLGVRSAKHDNVIILDCDMAPVPNLVKTYAEWLVLDYKVILIGHRRYVDANQVEPSDVLRTPSLMLDLPPVATKNKVMAKSPSKDWREPIYQETNMLIHSPHPFRTSSCGNVAFNRRIFKDAGDFDEAFTAWGAEDNEFGYRVWNAGYYFVPLVDALG